MKDNKLNLAAPWLIFYRELEALFGEDPDITVEYDKGERAVKLRVNGEKKAEALAKLLPSQRTFGDVTVKVQVIPANLQEASKVELFAAAFEGNPALSYIHSVEDPANPFELNYVVFRNKVVQFFTDDLGDINGLRSTLYESIAEDVFEDRDGIFFCTDVEPSDKGAQV